MTMCAGSGFPQCLHRGEHAGPGREPVIDEDDRLTGHVGGRATIAIGGLTSQQFTSLVFGDITQLLRRDSQRPQYIVVDHHSATTGQGAHRELFMAGCAQLAHDERIQRNPQGRSHFPRDGNPASGQTQHHDILLAAVRTQQIGQYAARLTAVTKDPPRGTSHQARR